MAKAQDTSSIRSLAQANVLITGGGSGVGLETAKLFVGLGASVTLMGRSVARLEMASKEMQPGRCAFFAGDVAASASASAAIEYAAKTWGASVNILVNNAGLILRKNAVDTSDEDWARIMDVNVTGLFYMSRAAARQMPDDGAIINLSSTCGRFGEAGLTAYCASKGAVDQITRSMALELAARRITVNAVAPGAINSPMLYSQHDSVDMAETAAQRNAQAIPIGRVAEAAEIARAILYLARERHITGTVLRIDGGYTA